MVQSVAKVGIPPKWDNGKKCNGLLLGWVHDLVFSTLMAFTMIFHPDSPFLVAYEALEIPGDIC